MPLDQCDTHLSAEFPQALTDGLAERAKDCFFRYVGTMTLGYRQYHRTGLWLCHSRIVVSPSCGLGGSTTGETTSLFTNQRRNGRAFSSLTARGGGLPIGVNRAGGPGLAAEDALSPRMWG